MFVLYDPPTGVINAVADVTDAEGYVKILEKLGQAYITAEGRLTKTLQHYRVIDGILCEVPEMEILAPEQVTAGAEFVVTGVPAGARILLDGVEAGVMDNSGDLELSFDTPGRYRMTFLMDGFMPKEISIEARS